MRQILQSLGDKMTDQELDEMMETADSDHDGFINYEGQNLFFYFKYIFIDSFVNCAVDIFI